MAMLVITRRIQRVIEAQFSDGIRQRLQEDPPPKDETKSVAVRPLRQLTFANSMPSELYPRPFVIPIYVCIYTYISYHIISYHIILYTLDFHYR